MILQNAFLTPGYWDLGNPDEVQESNRMEVYLAARYSQFGRNESRSGANR